MQALDDDRIYAAWRSPRIDDLGDAADRRVGAIDTGHHYQHAIGTLRRRYGRFRVRRFHGQRHHGNS